jgi:hypothetical protein
VAASFVGPEALAHRSPPSKVMQTSQVNCWGLTLEYARNATKATATIQNTAERLSRIGTSPEKSAFAS